MSASPSGTHETIGLALEIRGSVQGVGFRPWVVRTARDLGLRGRVRNCGDGVEVQAFGTSRALEGLQRRLEAAELPGLVLERIALRPLGDIRPPADFRAAASLAGRGAGAAATPPLVPDLPVCTDCLDEIRDPSARRYLYPFTHCASCGPRYSVARQLPWDRERTSMAGFEPCAACAAEYADPADRRFHAETLCCPDCGPRLAALAPAGAQRAEADAALALARDTLRAGGTVALQGLGGFQLACDALSESAVRRLRRRKRRGRKPFAVMLGDLADAEKHAQLDAEERDLLCSIARPIVLVRRRVGSSLAHALAPGSPLLGLMLPTTPLHALLLDCVGRPLVMTSGNRSGEPIVHRIDDALARLADAADLLLFHDRTIERPCDDSVVRVAARAPLVLRRARGFVPRPIRLARPLRQPTLALGAQWNNTVCVAVGDRAWPSVHIGDLESPQSLEFLERSVAGLLAWLGVRPELVAHDAHPHYESTRLALSWPEVRRIAVQHHHAHLASLLAESGTTGPVLGLVWDGTGLGDDGSAWGGELLAGDATGAERVATFRPLRLAGGDRAVREVWRLALAALEDAFAGEPPLEALALFARLERDAVDRVRALLAADTACPRAHGAGRLFDAVGSLLLARPTAGFQGEVAIALESAARGRRGPAYPFALDRTHAPWQLDWRPTLRAVVRDLLAERPLREVARRFHGTLVEAGAALLRETRRIRGISTLALSGGCFQNRILVEGLVQSFAGECSLLRHRELPPGDGGLAVGQALAADAIATRLDGRDSAPEGARPCV